MSLTTTDCLSYVKIFIKLNIISMFNRLDLKNKNRARRQYSEYSLIFLNTSLYFWSFVSDPLIFNIFSIMVLKRFHFDFC